MTKHPTPTAANVLDVLAAATPDQYAAGMTWYDDAHALAVSLDSDVDRACGVIAALSPQLSWDRNVVLAKRIYDGGLDSGCLPASIAKAERILAGETPLDVLGGLKVRSFFQNIIDPADDWTVTIDRHSTDIAIGVRSDNDSRIGMTPKRYLAWSDAHREAAADAGILPQQVQAITWETWRARWAWRKTAAA